MIMQHILDEESKFVFGAKANVMSDAETEPYFSKQQLDKKSALNKSALQS